MSTASDIRCASSESSLICYVFLGWDKDLLPLRDYSPGPVPAMAQCESQRAVSAVQVHGYYFQTWTTGELLARRICIVSSRSIADRKLDSRNSSPIRKTYTHTTLSLREFDALSGVRQVTSMSSKTAMVKGQISCVPGLDVFVGCIESQRPILLKPDISRISTRGHVIRQTSRGGE